MAGDREAVLDAGMNDHIAKPIDFELFYRTLTTWLVDFKRPVPIPHASMTAAPATGQIAVTADGDSGWGADSASIATTVAP